MFYGRHKISLADLRKYLIAIVLAAGFSPALYADEIFYGLRPGSVGIDTPQPSALVTADRAPVVRYLSRAELQIADFPAPPAAGSAKDRADLAAVLKWQKDRTQAQCSAARAQFEHNFNNFFGDVSPFREPMTQEAETFFKRVAYEAVEANSYIKKVYQRERPFLRSEELDPCLGRVRGFSYPSGHAAMSHLLGLILSDLLPRQGAVFMRAADQAGLNRVIGGVHHPSDVEAGKKLGDVLYKKMLKNPKFVSDMEALTGSFK